MQQQHARCARALPCNYKNCIQDPDKRNIAIAARSIRKHLVRRSHRNDHSSITPLPTHTLLKLGSDDHTHNWCELVVTVSTPI